jgi:Tripartite tricarboxylate transporter TctB family
MEARVSNETADDDMLLSRRSLGILVALLTLSFGAVIILGATEFSVGWSERGPEPGYFPFWIGCVIVAGSLCTLAQTVLATNEGRHPAITRGQAQRAMTFLLPMIGFVAVAHLLGIYVATILYLFSVMVFQGRYTVALSSALSLGTAVSLYVMFDKWLKVPLAKGPIEALLGIH